MRYKAGTSNPDEPTDLSAEARNKRRSKRLSASLNNLHNSLVRFLAALKQQEQQAFMLQAHFHTQAIFKPGQLKPEVSSLKSTAPYKIKTIILKALSKIIASPALYCYVRSPVNFIFAELANPRIKNLLKLDQSYRGLYHARPSETFVWLTHPAHKLARSVFLAYCSRSQIVLSFSIEFGGMMRHTTCPSKGLLLPFYFTMCVCVNHD